MYATGFHKYGEPERNTMDRRGVPDLLILSGSYNLNPLASEILEVKSSSSIAYYKVMFSGWQLIAN